MSDFDTSAFLSAVVRQDAAKLGFYFKPTAKIFWHNSGEEFTVAEYIRANCEYPGEWSGVAERVECLGDLLIMVVKVESSDGYSARTVSFAQIGTDGKIARLDEYWGDVGAPPEWREKLFTAE